eukprot:gene77-86_t
MNIISLSLSRMKACMSQSFAPNPSFAVSSLHNETLGKGKTKVYYCCDARDEVSCVHFNLRSRPFPQSAVLGDFYFTTHLGVVGWDHAFSFVLVGSEGSARDGRIFSDALLKGLLLPADKFYLGDAGYALLLCLLTPPRRPTPASPTIVVFATVACQQVSKR